MKSSHGKPFRYIPLSIDFITAILLYIRNGMLAFFLFRIMKLDIKDIEGIAELARLHLTEDEKVRYAGQLSAVLDYVEMLNEVDTTGVAETCQVTGLEDVVREDIATPCDEETRKKIIDQFPAKVGNLLKVKAVFSDTE